MRDKELLVILSRDGAEEAYELVRTRHRIKQQASSRVLIIERPDQIASLQSHPAVMAVSDGEVGSDVLKTLDQGELLFARAWSRRARMEGKVRPGQGLDWDAPGFDPPDAPDS